MNSKIILCKNIYMDKNYNNVLSYSESDMLNLCTSQEHLVAQANDYSFLRQTGSIMAGFTYSQCLQANYIAFQNPDYSNKWFFAWVDDVIYKGNNNTEITFTIDAWSTWYDYWTSKTCFINRQHVNDDTIGLHTIPENLDIGEVIEEAVTEDTAYGNTFGYWIAIATNWIIKDGSYGDNPLVEQGKQYSGITVYDNTVFGTQLVLFEINSMSDFVNVYDYILRTNGDGHIEDIENIFILPQVAIDSTKLTSHTAYVIEQQYEFTFYTLGFDMLPETFNTTITKRTSFYDYTPKNNKCFVYPYNYLFVSNNQGSNNIYKYEDFTSQNCVFQNQFSISIGGSGRLVPLNYKRMTSNDDEALPLGKYPTCAWSSDAFTNWLTQNSINLATNMVSTVANVGLAVATGGTSLVATARHRG